MIFGAVITNGKAQPSGIWSPTCLISPLGSTGVTTEGWPYSQVELTMQISEKGMNRIHRR